ncbi:hypothetical protein NL676_036981 [Syzygium grande]|nr:hypothetical protein NL676_036981 [Syzygium grande]
MNTYKELQNGYWVTDTFVLASQSEIPKLSVGVHYLIFQLLHSSEILQTLKDFLSNDQHIFISVEIAKDVNKLVCNYGLNVSNARDLRSLAKNVDLEIPKDCELKVLAKEILGWKMEKRKQVTVS